VSETDVPRLSQALARAFHNDPVMSWIYPDGSRRLQRLERGFALYLRKISLRHDACYAIDGLLGGALWMPPGTWRLDVLEQLWLLPAIARVAGRNLPRLFRIVDAMESKHPDDPHYYLAAIGIEPEWQGRGFGSALLRPVLERCDGEGLPAYLEASTWRSRALYERNDFELVQELNFAEDAPPLWLMWREPKA
jgi:ribosomal protein S18 acetylase RimI-like enzyme